MPVFGTVFFLLRLFGAWLDLLHDCLAVRVPLQAVRNVGRERRVDSLPPRRAPRPERLARGRANLGRQYDFVRRAPLVLRSALCIGLLAVWVSDGHIMYNLAFACLLPFILPARTGLYHWQSVQNIWFTFVHFFAFCMVYPQKQPKPKKPELLVKLYGRPYYKIWFTRTFCRI